MLMKTIDSKTDQEINTTDFVFEDINSPKWYEQAIAGANDIDDIERFFSFIFKIQQQVPTTTKTTVSTVTNGRTQTVHAPKGVDFTIKYELREASDLITSHDTAFQKDERFPHELGVQNKDRTRVGSKDQVSTMVNDMVISKPELLGESLKSNDGAPIIGKDNVVESGNGRTIALKTAYEGGKSDAYKTWLRANIAQFGLSEGVLDGMSKPILVRVRQTDEKDMKLSRGELAVIMNQESGLRLSPYEKALDDASKLSDSTLELFNPAENGEVLTHDNRHFVRAFLSNLTPDERGEYLTKNGLPTPLLGGRIKNSIVAKAFKDERILSMITEEDSEIKSITNALIKASGPFAALRGLDPSMGGVDVSVNIVDACKLILKAKMDAEADNLQGNLAFKVERSFQQQSMFTKRDPASEKLALWLASNQTKTNLMAAVFKNISALIKTEIISKQQTSMFPRKALSKDAIITQSIEKATAEFNERNQTMTGSQRSMFEDIGTEDVIQKDMSFWAKSIQASKSFLDIASIFRTLFELGTDQIPGQTAPVTPTDYKDDDTDFGLIKGGIKTREKINEQVKEILARIDNPEQLTGADRNILKQYSGKGGLSENSQYEYYTPTFLAEGLWDLLKEHGYENGNVLEPSTGAGVFSATKPKGTLVTGTEIDPVSSKVNQLLHPEDTIMNQSFEKLAVTVPDNTYDAITGNVPFGRVRGISIHDDPAYKSETRIERYFLLRALDKLKPGGLMCFVVHSNVVGQKGKPWERFRIELSKKAEFLGAHKLPSKTFSAQGTDFVVDVAVFKKHPEDLLEKINDIPFSTLTKSKVIFKEFIEGMYWTGEGRPFIMGTYIPKVPGAFRSQEIVDGDIDNASMKAKLAQRFHSRIDWELLNSAEPIQRNYIEGDRKVINSKLFEMKDGAWELVIEVVDKVVALDQDRYGASSLDELKARLESHTSTLGFTAEQFFAISKDYNELLTQWQKDAITFAMAQSTKYVEQVFRGSIIGSMIARHKDVQAGESSTDISLQGLQELVVNEISKYGHPKNNKGLLLAGEASRTFGVFSNAIDEKGNFSDLLAGTLQQADNALQFDSTNVQSIVEHLFFREGIQSIEFEDILKTYTGKVVFNNLGDVADLEPNVAVTPDGMLVPMRKYASGDIVPKLQALTQAIGAETDERLQLKYQQAIDEINSRRTKVETNAITFGLQQKWFDKQHIIDFLHSNGYQHIRYRTSEWIEEEDYNGVVKKKKIFVDDPNNPFGEFVGTEREQGFDAQFINYLNGAQVTSSKEEYKKEYKDAVKILEDNFNVHMQQNDNADALTEEYNLKFNGFVPYEYDTGDLGLHGASGRVVLKGHQAAVIRRFSEEGRGCIAHDVGLGKTFEALGLIAYNKQMGRSKKACIVVPKAVLGNWYGEAKKFYGNLDDALFVGFEPKRDKSGEIMQEPILDEEGNQQINKFTGKPEFQDVLVEDSPQEIFEKMWKIPQTNLGLVVMTKEKYGAIPMKAATRKEYADKMVARQLISDKAAVVAVTGDDPDNVLLGSGKAKISYAEAIQAEQYAQMFADDGTEKKGEYPYYEDMGFDSVIIDEAHDYKNSYQGGKNSKNIAYLPTAPSAKRAIDMTMKMNFLRDRNSGRGSYLLTATPVTNSPFEIFNMLSLTCPVEEFESFGIYTVDDFVRVFGRIVPVQKTRVSGEIVTTDGLTGFQNLDGLRNMFHKYVEMKTAEDVNLDLPPHTEHNEDVFMNDEQKDLYEILRADALEAAKPGSKISMFSVIRNMDRVTTDLDLYRHTMTFVFKLEDREKVDKLVAALPSTLKAKKKKKDKDVIEDDEKVDTDVLVGDDGEILKNQPTKLSVETRVDGNSYIVIVPEEYEETVALKFKQFKIAPDTVSHPVAPKYAKLIENATKDLEARGKQLVFTEEKSQHNKVKRILVHHLPVTDDQIMIINASTADGDKLQVIADAYNSGKCRIIVANKKAEVGVNLQKGTTAIHHLTLPWTPASIQQRNGRGVRQGNTAEHIHIYYYLGKGSFDEFRLDLLKNKSNWMKDLFFGDKSEVDNGDANNDNDYSDLLAADPEEAKRIRLQRIAEQQAKDKEKNNKVLVNTLQQLASAATHLKSLEAAKAQEFATIEDTLVSAQRLLNKQKTDLADNKAFNNPDKKYMDELESKVVISQYTVNRLNERKASLDKKYEDKKIELESRIKQKAGYLRGKNKNNELPFDASLIDNPENVVVTTDGRVISTGNIYEITGAKDGARFKLASGHSVGFNGAIFKILEVDTSKRLFKVENIVGRVSFPDKKISATETLWNWHDINIFPSKGLTQVSYSEKEVELKKMLNSTWGFGDLVKGKPDKQTLLENITQVKFDTDYMFIFRNQATGAIEFHQPMAAKDPDAYRFIYPEVGNEDFKKEVCVAYLDFLKSEQDYSTTNKVNRAMATMFGGGYKNTAEAYGRIATDLEVRELISKMWEEFVSSNRDKTASEMCSFFLTTSGIWGDISAEALQLGDNRETIQDIVYELKIMTQDIFRKKKTDEANAIKLQDEANKLQDEAKAKEALKTHPDYKEISPEVEAAFKKLGLTVKYNNEPVPIPRFRKAGVDIAPPFSRLFIQDSVYDGPLKKCKDILKTRHQGQFFKNACQGFMGAWWHVPSSVDIAEIYKLMG